MNRHDRKISIACFRSGRVFYQSRLDGRDRGWYIIERDGDVHGPFANRMLAERALDQLTANGSPAEPTRQAAVQASAAPAKTTPETTTASNDREGPAMSEHISSIVRWLKRKSPPAERPAAPRDDGQRGDKAGPTPFRGGRVVGIVQVTDTRLCVGVARVKGGRAMVLRTAAEDTDPAADIVERVTALARGLGFAKGALYVVASVQGLDMVPIALPPASRSALQRLIVGRLATELRVPAADMVWAASPTLWKRGGKGPRRGLVLAAPRKLVDIWNGLERHGYTLELLTTHELALAAVTARLAPDKDGLYALSTDTGTSLVAVGANGPFFARRLDLTPSAPGFAPTLYDEAHHSALYIHQHLRTRIERLGLIGPGVSPAVTAKEFPGWELLLLDGSTIVASRGADDLFLAAASAALAANQAPANLMAPQSDSRRLVGSALLLLWIGAGLAVTLVMMQHLDLETRHNRLTWQLDDLEKELIPLREAARPTAQTIENRAHNTLAQSTELQYPVWWALMRELSLTLSPDIHFESMTVNRIEERGRRRGARRGAQNTQLPEQWQLGIKGRIDSGTYARQQEVFGRWHESLLRSPFLTQVNVSELGLTAGGRMQTDDAIVPTMLRFTVTAQVLSGRGVQDVLAKLD